jgi:hypothetical protein
MRNAWKVLVRDSEGRYHFGDLDAVWRRIL